MVLFDLINDKHLIVARWMVVGGGNDAGLSEPIESQAMFALSSSSNDSKRENEEDNEEVDITRYGDATEEKEEEGFERETNPKDAHPNPFIFTLHFTTFVINISIIVLIIYYFWVCRDKVGPEDNIGQAG